MLIGQPVDDLLNINEEHPSSVANVDVLERQSVYSGDEPPPNRRRRVLMPKSSAAMLAGNPSLSQRGGFIADLVSSNRLPDDKATSEHRKPSESFPLRTEGLPLRTSSRTPTGDTNLVPTGSSSALDSKTTRRPSSSTVTTVGRNNPSVRQGQAPSSSSLSIASSSSLLLSAKSRSARPSSSEVAENKSLEALPSTNFTPENPKTRDRKKHPLSSLSHSPHEVENGTLAADKEPAAEGSGLLSHSPPSQNLHIPLQMREGEYIEPMMNVIPHDESEEDDIMGPSAGDGMSVFDMRVNACSTRGELLQHLHDTLCHPPLRIPGSSEVRAESPPSQKQGSKKGLQRRLDNDRVMVPQEGPERVGNVASIERDDGSGSGSSSEITLEQAELAVLRLGALQQDRSREHGGGSNRWRQVGARLTRLLHTGFRALPVMAVGQAGGARSRAPNDERYVPLASGIRAVKLLEALARLGPAFYQRFVIFPLACIPWIDVGLNKDTSL